MQLRWKQISRKRKKPIEKRLKLNVYTLLIIIVSFSEMIQDGIFALFIVYYLQKGDRFP